ISILHTPGHTPDDICIHAGSALFTGDTLFVGKVGGTWSDEESRQEYRSLHERVMALPDETRVYPGHDYGVRPFSTIGEEKTANPFLLQPDVEAFIDLKANWAAYKKAHGIA
ncbi:MAG TPA: MBL fold metallo-hydrolase, partial [Chlorobaculum parvum]|nr:MBL fold metallo-hydrolase [Chlorobaculum parvum]